MSRADIQRKVATVIDPLPFRRQTGDDRGDVDRQQHDRKRRGTAYRKARAVLKVIELEKGILL